MAGHSQYANIKHRKDAQVNVVKFFKKLSKEIYVAVKLGGPHIESNPRLKLMLEKARRINMPKDNINRAINKANNKNETIHYDAITYEGYGPGNVAILVHCLTDNKNRSASNIRSYFNKAGGNLGATNSVQYLFQTAGVIEFVSSLPLDDILEIVLDFEVFKLAKKADIVYLVVLAKQLAIVTNRLAQNGIIDLITNNDIVNIPYQTITLQEPHQIQNFYTLLQTIENDEDVLLVEHNFQE